MCETCCDCRPTKRATYAPVTRDHLELVRDILNTHATQQLIRIEPWRRAHFHTLYQMYRAATDTPVGPNKYARILTQLGFESIKGTNGVRLRTGIGIPGIAP